VGAGCRARAQVAVGRRPGKENLSNLSDKDEIE